MSWNAMVMQIKTTMNAMIMTTTVMMLTITDINQKWTLCILGPLFWSDFRANPLYKSKDPQ